LMHGTLTGAAGGRNCVGCHNGSGILAVDVPAMNVSDDIHFNLNNNSTMTLDSANRMCWACHTNDSLASGDVVDETEIPVSGHPDGFNTPKNCTDCHISSTKFGAPIITEHNPSGSELQTTYTCVQCHNNSIRPFTDTQTNLTTNTDTSDPDFNKGRVSHYANTSELQSSGTGTTYCLNCHNNSIEGAKYGLNYLSDIHGNKDCRNCHRNGFTPIVNLHDVNIKIENPYFNDDGDNYCLNCHPNHGELIGSHGNATNNVQCNNCHMNKTTPVIYAKTVVDETKNTNTVFHTKGTVATYPVTLVPGNTSLTRGTLAYNRSQCTVCHDQVVTENHNPGKECTTCHSSRTANPTWHSTDISGGAGGPDCVSCHDISGGLSVTINMSLFTQSPHLNINGGNDTNNKQCYMCHRDGTAPTEETGQTEHTSGTVRTNATNRSCDDVACHGNTSSPISVGSHFDNATQYGRLEASFIRTTQSCEFCHGKTQVPIFNESIPGNGGNISMVLDDGTGPTGHYLRNIADGDNH
ncbi:MAG: hypothetical protein KAJ19_11435, partial [Gammaproteobacteria bacterium]|nr:hypothetical protein [Gammaproteobacteria bacterium]